MANTTRITDRYLGKRVLTVYPFEAHTEVYEGEQQVYLAIEDGESNLLGNMNVSREELLGALNAIGLRKEN